MTEFVNHKSSYLLKRLIKNHVIPYKWTVFLAMFFMIIVAACAALTVKMVKPAVDDVFLTHNKNQLIILPLIMLLIYSIKGIAEYFQSYLVKYTGQRILTDLQIQMYEHLLLADLSFIQSQSSGRLISRFTSDITLMRGAISQILVGCAKHFLTVLFLIILMFSTDALLSCFVFFVFPMAIYPIQKIGRRIRNIMGKTQEEVANYTARLDETFQSIKVIKAFSAEKIEAERARRIMNNILDFYKKTAKFDALTSPIMEILSGIAIACLLWYGGYMVMSGQTTPGALFSFITAFVSAYRPFKSLVSLNVNIQESMAATNRVFNILDCSPTIKDNPNVQEMKFHKGEISFSDIEMNFGDKPALKQINLKIESGKTYAFVGRSGSGKTTLSNLLIRFYDPISGTISIDGKDIKEIKIKSLRDQISLVTQDTILFDTTIFENIAYGKDSYTKKQVIDAAIAADAHEFIDKLPKKYDTDAGVSGHSLSGGQRQRISIARAFIKDAPILVLDEATSSLDPSSEEKIIESLKKFRKDRTTIFITHRLASIKHVDKIIVVQDNEICEQGTHEELIEKKGEYHHLFNKQLKEYKESV